MFKYNYNFWLILWNSDNISSRFQIKIVLFAFFFHEGQTGKNVTFAVLEYRKENKFIFKQCNTNVFTFTLG